MNGEVRDFYKEEAEYEKSIILTKELIKKIIEQDINQITKKIDNLDSKKYNEFFDLFNAIIGKETNKYFYCTNVEDTKYTNLEIGQVYKMSEITMDIQSKYQKPVVLNLQARGILAEQFIEMVKELKNVFSENLYKEAESFQSADSEYIYEKDIKYMENLIEYLELMKDKTGRLKVLVAERDVYALESAIKEYNKKSSITKWFNKKFNLEKNVIESIAEKRKAK